MDVGRIALSVCVWMCFKFQFSCDLCRSTVETRNKWTTNLIAVIWWALFLCLIHPWNSAEDSLAVQVRLLFLFWTSVWVSLIGIQIQPSQRRVLILIIDGNARGKRNQNTDEMNEYGHRTKSHSHTHIISLFCFCWHKKNAEIIHWNFRYGRLCESKSTTKEKHGPICFFKLKKVNDNILADPLVVTW